MRMKQNIVDGACIIDFLCAEGRFNAFTFPSVEQESCSFFKYESPRRSAAHGVIGGSRGGARCFARCGGFPLMAVNFKVLTWGNSAGLDVSCGCFNRSPLFS